MDRGAWWAAVHGVAKSWTQLTDFTFTFHFHALEKEMATHSSVLAWRIPGTGSLVGCRLWGCTVGHSWSDLAAAADGLRSSLVYISIYSFAFLCCLFLQGFLLLKVSAERRGVRKYTMDNNSTENLCFTKCPIHVTNLKEYRSFVFIFLQ